MVEAQQMLQDCRRIVVVDWPSREVPDALVLAGYSVVVKSGPGPDDYAAQELHDGQVVGGGGVRRPIAADLVYAHRPLDELPQIVALARQVGATAVWRQSGLRSDGSRDPAGCWVSDDEGRAARQVVESAGLTYVDDAYIADVARATPRREPR